ncbi:hypothetical protein IW261DRAFT_1597059 [Armillaria novae-zelandiae]|uniref:Uncharacterized protein n=1 Tax=Armillaria novae-zelandiae TaxID=153914 RepID=A0AA39NUY8_9AGAR|nr:hypothetical protein IW261DRAFT_1597059 [Armillaria novae-zelandiae]
MAESGKSVSISQSSSLSMRLPDVQIEQMSPEVLAEFFINSLPQCRSVVTVLADFTRAYRMDGKAFLAISRNDIETLLRVQAPTVVDALTRLQEAATGQRRPERRPKLQLAAVFHDLEGRIPSAREISADGETQDELSVLEGHDEQWVFNDELTPHIDGDILFSSTAGVPAEDDRLVSPSASTPSSSPRRVPIIFDTSPDMTISPSTFISPQTMINSRDAEFFTAPGGHIYSGMPKEEHGESQITDMTGLKLIPIDETLSYVRPIDAHGATARIGSSLPETEEFGLANTTHLGTGGDRCIDISSEEPNCDGSLSDWIDSDRLGVFGGQDVHKMKADAEVGQSASSTCLSHDQLSSTPQNNSKDPSRLTGNSWLAPPIELSNNSSLLQESRRPFSSTSDDKSNSSSDRCEDYGLNVSPHDGRAIEQHALVISEHGSQDCPNQSLSLSDTDEQIKGNSPSSYKSEGLANTSIPNDSSPFFDDTSPSSSSSRESSNSVRYVAAIRPATSVTKGTDDSPVTISPTGINPSYRIAAPRLPSPGFLSKNAIHIAGDIASKADADAMMLPIVIHGSISGNAESAEPMLGGPIGTTDSEKMSPDLEVTNSYSPDASSLLNLHATAEDPPEDDGFTLMTHDFSASTSDISLELGSWIVVPRPSEESRHSLPPPEVYPASAMPPIEASSHPNVGDSDIASVPAAGTSSTYQVQGLPEIPCLPLFHDGELELRFGRQTVRSRGAGKESVSPSHKWETDERPFFGQSHASPSFLEQRISTPKKGKWKGKERNNTTYQDMIVQTDVPLVDPSVEDPRIVQLSRKVNCLQEEVRTLKVENENLKRQNLRARFFSRSPVNGSSLQPTLGYISTYFDLRFVPV